MKAVKHLFALSTIAAATVLSNQAMAATVQGGDFYVSIRITPTCKVSTATNGKPATLAKSAMGADIDLGERYLGAEEAADGASIAGNSNGIKVTCTNKTPYKISLTPSNNNTDGRGEMSMVRKQAGTSDSNGTESTQEDNEKIAYTLYQNDGYATVWGSGDQAKSFEGTGTEQSHSVWAKVTNDQYNKAAGRYADRVKVTLTY